MKLYDAKYSITHYECTMSIRKAVGNLTTKCISLHNELTSSYISQRTPRFHTSLLGKPAEKLEITNYSIIHLN